MQNTVGPKMAADIDSHTPQQRFQYSILDAGFPHWITILCKKQTAFSVQIQQYWKLVIVVKRSVIGPWEFQGRGLPWAGGGAILGPTVFDVAHLYGESGWSCI